MQSTTTDAPAALEGDEASIGWAYLHLAPSTRTTRVTTTTTTTIHYAPIPVPKPKSPTLSGDYLADRKRYPLAFSSKGNNALRSVTLGAAVHDGDTSTVSATYVSAGPNQPQSSRKGKRRMLSSDNGHDQVVSDRLLDGIASRRASAPHLPSSNAETSVRGAMEPPRKRARLEIGVAGPSRSTQDMQAGPPSPVLSPPSSPAAAEEAERDENVTIETYDTIDEPSLHISKRMTKTTSNHNDFGFRPSDIIPSRELAMLMSMPAIVKEYESMPAASQAHILCELIRRSSTEVLQQVNAIVTPALKRNFVSELPPELAAVILSHLDCAELLSCTLVCRRWRNYINTQGKLWANLLHAENLWTGNPDPARTEDAEAATLVKNGARNRRTGHERNIRELLAAEDQVTQGFPNHQRDNGWDEHFDLNEAARPTEVKLEEVRNRALGATVQDGVDRKPPRLRRSVARNLHQQSTPATRLASPVSADEGQNEDAKEDRTDTKTVALHGDIHPLKLLYKKRKIVGRQWAKPVPPHRVTISTGHSSVVTCLQFDNEKLVSASDDPFIDVFNVVTGQRMQRLHGHEGGVWALQYIGNTLVSGSTDRSLRVWNLETGSCTHVFTGHTSTVRCLQIVEPMNVNPDPSGPPVWEPPYPLVVTGSRDWSLRVWKLPSGRRHFRPAYHPPSPSEGGSQGAPESNPYHLRLLQGHTLAVRAISARGRTLVSGSYDHTLRVWDLLDGTCKHELKGHQQKVYSVTLDHARKRCASGSMDGTVRIWSIRTGEQLHRLDGHSSLVGLLGLSYHFLVSAGADSTLKIWDPQSGSCIDTLQANAGAITCFEHDDYRIVSGADGQLRIWDIRLGIPIRDIFENMNNVWQVTMNDRFCVAAVQRDGHSELEILDFFPELRQPPPPDEVEELAEDNLSDFDAEGLVPRTPANNRRSLDTVYGYGNVRQGNVLSKSALPMKTPTQPAAVTSNRTQTAAQPHLPVSLPPIDTLWMPHPHGDVGSSLYPADSYALAAQNSHAQVTDNAHAEHTAAWQGGDSYVVQPSSSSPEIKSEQGVPSSASRASSSHNVEQ